MGGKLDQDWDAEKGKPGQPCPAAEWGCEGVMRVRKNHKTGERFLGCSEYPECTETMEL